MAEEQMAAFARAVPGSDTRLVRLTRSRDVGVAAFGKVAARLEETNGLMASFVTCLRDLGRASLSEEGAHDPLADVSHTLRHLSGILAHLGDDSCSNGLADAHRQGQSALDALHRESIKLMAISAITLINSRSIGGVDLGDYVNSLRQMADDLQDGAAAVSSGLVRIGVAQGNGAATSASASHTLATADQVIEGSRQGTSLQARHLDDARRSMAELAAKLGKDAAQEVQILMTGIQFSDAYSQRIEHVCAMIDRLDLTQMPTERLAVETLMAAQLWSLAQESDAAVASSCQSLERISAMAARVRSAFGGGHDGADAAPNHLQHRRSALDQAVQSRRVIEPAIAAANAAAVSVRHDVEAAVTRFAGLIRTTEAMTLSAFNAGLITSRGGIAREALSVLALAVHESVDACGRQIKRCQAALQTIGQKHNSATIAQVDAAAEEFVARIDICSRDLANTEAKLQQIRGLRESSAQTGTNLLASTAATTGEVVYLLDASKELRDLARELAEDPGNAVVTDVSPATLDDIYEGYTMDRERQIHDRLFGRARRAAAKTSIEVLDDILF